MHHKKLFLALLATALICVAAAACLLILRERDPHKKSLILYLPFDEGKGTTVSDASGNLPDADISYVFNHAAFMENQDPQWRSKGISGGCLLFDGNSTYVTYNKSTIALEGQSLSISVWVAPRAFEWDDPNAADNGTDQITGILSQSNRESCQGVLLGYQRHGRLSFQVGTGKEWLSIWSNGDNLQKYQWNLVTAIFDGQAGEMCLYLNGEKVASRSVPQGSAIAHAKNRTLLIGRNGEGERLPAGFLQACSGYLDELKVYDCVLAPEEIGKAYTQAKIPSIPFSEIWLQNILTTDVYRPQFHGGPYQNWMNEPHAPLYYNGMYHLFFQQNLTGPYWRSICWGHLVSEDMVNWKPVKEAVTPAENSVAPDGIWSGGATTDKNGVPVLFFTAGNDSFVKDGLISNQNIGAAYPSDLSDPELTDWIVCKELAIAQQPGQGRTGEFRDPHIWKEGGTWCMLVCSGSTASAGGSALLFTTNTLEVRSDGTIDMNWKYRGPIYEMENPSMLYGSTWELPILMPVTNATGTATKYMFAFSPAPAGIADNKIYYFVGDFSLETGKFTPDPGFAGIPALLDYGCNVFTGPSAFRDPASGEVYMFSIMQGQRSGADEGAAGWAHTVGLARKLWLNEEGTDLNMCPIDALHDLETSVLINETQLSLFQANEKLASVQGDMLYIKVVIENQSAQEFGIDVKTGGTRDRTSYTYQTAEGKIFGETQNKGPGAPTSFVSGLLPLEDGILEMEIYIDRSLVEAFFNESKSISIRAYTEDPSSQGIALFADGDILIRQLYVAEMGSIF